VTSSRECINIIGYIEVFGNHVSIMNTSHQSAKAPRQAVKSSARNDLDRIEASGNAWWSKAPEIAMICIAGAIAPFRLLAWAADFAVSVAFLIMIGVIAAAIGGYIPDKVVAEALNVVGTRLLTILESAGLI
jgi:hypothetical protein